jgi:hypothetical protein
VPVLVGAALAVKAAPAVLGAVAGLVQVLLIAAAVIVGVGAAGLVGPLAWWWRRTPLGAARARSELHRGHAPAPRRGAGRSAAPSAAAKCGGTSPPAGPPGVHRHLHGVPAEDIAAVLAFTGPLPARCSMSQLVTICGNETTERSMGPAGAGKERSIPHGRGPRQGPADGASPPAPRTGAGRQGTGSAPYRHPVHLRGAAPGGTAVIFGLRDE